MAKTPKKKTAPKNVVVKKPAKKNLFAQVTKLCCGKSPKLSCRAIMELVARDGSEHGDKVLSVLNSGFTSPRKIAVIKTIKDK